jgi:hypothetical protein
MRECVGCMKNHNLVLLVFETGSDWLLQCRRVGAEAEYCAAKVGTLACYR